ncbi:MAG: sigma-54-dependent Fis family transcriptional regulator, partial [Lentisphaerae bacterium]|nr:sigma-54-dependent Fis family transcriptional regulator [Lentisphaerota bacterium]
MANKQRILVVDDELGPRESLKAIFSGRYEVAAAADANEALRILTASAFDLVMLDVILPGKDGVTLLKEIRDMYPRMPVIMVSASTSVRPVVEAMRFGAFDYVSKPFDVAELLHTAERAIQGGVLGRRLEVLESDVEREFPVGNIVGSAPSFQAALSDLRKAAVSDATVLIHGESGTGKELAARMLHSLSPRSSEPFVPVHCAALPETLMESELFGHERGAFTGADRRKPGRFDLAGSGTLFFDEVGEMSLTTQVKLLRVLQEREFMRVGGTQVIKTNARIVAATSRNLREEAEEGKFRQDLFYRLSVVPVRLPPLRERRPDIPLLTGYFVGMFGQNLDAPAAEFSPAAMSLMENYAWPGNVRELRNIVERMIVLHGREQVILPDHLPAEFHGGALPTAEPKGKFEEQVNAYERALIEEALAKTDGVQ